MQRYAISATAYAVLIVEQYDRYMGVPQHRYHSARAKNRQGLGELTIDVF